jgi:hypothetical protein
MLDAPDTGEDTDSSARIMRGLVLDAAAALEQLQAELRAMVSGGAAGVEMVGGGAAGVDWRRVLARVEATNALLLRAIVLLEERRRR